MSNAKINWSQIDLVLFDLDGTLLDLYYENHFWQQALPAHLAECWGMPVPEVTAMLIAKQAEVENSLPWYNVAYWSKTLGLDLAPLREQLGDKVQPRPGALELLKRLQARDCPAWLATNTCPESLQLKLNRVPLAPYLARCVTAHELDAPKQTHRFWQRLFDGHTIPPQRCLFIDDTGAMLSAAQAFGIGHLRSIRQPDSNAAPNPPNGFIALDDFADLSA